MNTGGWLTSKRLRAHGLIVAVSIWSIYLWTLATPTLRDRNGNLKGTDFLHFYTLGCLARSHSGASLYDMNAQAELASQRVPQAAGIHYLPFYPPQVSIFFAPFASLSYGQALALWWGLGALVYGACCYAVWRACPALRNQSATVAFLAIGFPAFFHLIAWGQTSALALAIFTAAFFLLRNRCAFLAGLALGCLIFKPQLGIAAAIVFLATAAWKIVAGAMLSAAAQLAIGIVYYGMEPLRQWVNILWRVRGILSAFEPRPYQTHCLRTFCSMLVPWPSFSFGLYLITAVGVLILTTGLWRREATTPLALRYSALLIATVLIAPHLTVYDLIVLAPAVLLSSDWLLTEPRTSKAALVGTVLYLVYMLPLVGPLARWTHVQLSVIAMGALLYLIWHIPQEGPARPAPSVIPSESAVRSF